jgi:hypothetical protein
MARAELLNEPPGAVPDDTRLSRVGPRVSGDEARGWAEQMKTGARLRGGAPVRTARGAYFFLRAPALLAARKEIPARMAFCCTAAAVRPSFFATSLVGVPAFASDFKVFSSLALQDAPSFGGRFAITRYSRKHPTVGSGRNHTRFCEKRRVQHGERKGNRHVVGSGQLERGASQRFGSSLATGVFPPDHWPLATGFPAIDRLRQRLAEDSRGFHAPIRRGNAVTFATLHPPPVRVASLTLRSR